MLILNTYIDFRTLKWNAVSYIYGISMCCKKSIYEKSLYYIILQIIWETIYLHNIYL